MLIGVYPAAAPKEPSLIGFAIGLENKRLARDLIPLSPNSTFFPGKEEKRPNDLTP